MAKHKLNTLKQNDTPMHKYISKFTSLTRHAYNVDPSTPQTEMLILPFIDSLQNPFIKSKIRLGNSRTLSDIFQHALEEDTRQKVRAVDSGKPTSSNITQCDINAIRDNKCYKYVKDGHFIKDCPLNQDHSQYHHCQNYHKGGYSPLNTNESHSENTLATLAKAVSYLSLLWKEHTQKSYNSFQAQNHTHRQQHHRHSSHTKNNYHNKPDHSNRQRSQNTQHSSHTRSQHSSHNRSHHNSQNRSHNRQQHKDSTKINEIDELSDRSPDCSYRSDCEDYCTDHGTQEAED